MDATGSYTVMDVLRSLATSAQALAAHMDDEVRTDPIARLEAQDALLADIGALFREMGWDEATLLSWMAE
jgi:hypothetical protein